MNFQIIPVREDEKEILRNLLEKYNYEFSQYDQCDVNPLGLYGYSYLDNYWTEKGRWAFFLKVDGKLAGFAMVIDYPEAGKTDYNMAEFFVMFKYRRCGLGKWAAFQLFDKFQGTWQLKRHPKNLPSVGFWDHVIGEYTGGDFRLESMGGKIAYPDGTPGDVFFFSTSKK
ncbi:MAG: GNAT family N-acetyltransferase [Acutalibacter sp.]|nr:GNAT family N-acetyltransferase [Acutalibacter sp.]